MGRLIGLYLGGLSTLMVWSLEQILLGGIMVNLKIPDRTLADTELVGERTS